MHHGLRDVVPRNRVRPLAVDHDVVDADDLCENQILRRVRRVDLHAIDATPARWRGRGGLPSLDSVAPDSLVDFHTGQKRKKHPWTRTRRKTKSKDK